jgi:hypothetical protein
LGYGERRCEWWEWEDAGTVCFDDDDDGDGGRSFSW